MAQPLPMFPLGTVVLPGSAIPLHIFEERYRTLMTELRSGRIDPPRLGTVLIERGSEVGGGDLRAGVGTAVEAVSLQNLPDGRWLVLARGSERIRITEWLPDDPYPRAAVENFPDEDATPVDPRLVQEVARTVRRALALAVETGLLRGMPPAELPDHPVMAVWCLCAMAPLGPFDRQRLLEAVGPAQRLAHLKVMTEDACDLLAFRLKSD